MGKDPLKPQLSLLVKLGSLAVHVEELSSPKQHKFDVSAIQSILQDPEVKEWLEAMSKTALLPVKR